MKIFSFIFMLALPMQSMAAIFCGPNAYQNAIDEICVESIEAWPVAIYLKSDSEKMIRIPVVDVQVRKNEPYKVRVYLETNQQTGNLSEIELMHAPYDVDTYVYLNGTMYKDYDISASLISDTF